MNLTFYAPNDRNFYLLIASFLIFSFSSFSQVGINTTDPTADLDVNGNLRIRKMPERARQYILTSNKKGHISKYNAYLLYEANETNAAEDIVVNVSGNQIRDNIDLGMDIVVTIPKNRTAKVIINYSVPMGTLLDEDPPKTYMGIRFMKDENEMQQGSRKFTLTYNEQSAGQNISRMGTLSNTYIENFDPSTNERVITYGLYGYVEQYTESPSDQYQYKFNMWQPTGANYNWGKANISYQLYTK